MPRQTEDYEKGLAVRRALWRYEWACRWMGRPKSVMQLAERVSHIEGKAYRPFEEQAVFAADMERLLGGFDGLDRAVLVLVGQRGLGEVAAAKRLRTHQAEVTRRYWRTVEQMYRLLVVGGYVEESVALEGSEGPTGRGGERGTGEWRGTPQERAWVTRRRLYGPEGLKPPVAGVVNHGEDETEEAGRYRLLVAAGYVRDRVEAEASVPPSLPRRRARKGRRGTWRGSMQQRAWATRRRIYGPKGWSGGQQEAANHGEQQAEKAGGQASVAQVVSGRAGAGGERAGASGV
ncbi:MAG: hypothetical protein ACRD5F_03975 [Candidatus Acidiferrales bacterium]